MSQEKRRREDIYKERLEVYNRERHLFEEVGDSLASHSAIAIYGLNRNQSPRPIGSGVLFRCGDKLFIFTAAHVADEIRGKPALLTKNGRFVEMFGYMHLSRLPPSGKREDDKLDCAVLRVDGETAEALMPLAISVQDIHTPSPGAFYWRGFALVGYPARSFSIDGSTFSCTMSVLQTQEMLPTRYTRLGVEVATHKAFEWFNTVYTPQGVVRSQSLAGMSGCGVWIVPAMMEAEMRERVPFSQPKLIGIFTTHQKSNSALIATRINYHMEKIMEMYPDLPLFRRLRFG